MSLRRPRSRMLDLAVSMVCVACVCAPMLPLVHAASSDSPNPSLIESGGSVDQRVLESGIISNPLNGSFEASTSGRADGSLQWDLYSSATRGMKLVISTDRSPAMRDAENAVDVSDFDSAPSAWDVSGSDRRFGFTVDGSMGLSKFADGAKWQGFNGARGIEVTRRNGPIGKIRTTLRMRAEFGSALQSNARPTANVTMTAVPNI